jgi:hypothetical protein
LDAIVDLLVERGAAPARSFFAAWGDQRTASYVNADREARARAASGGHLPQLRGQLRYHLGEGALAEAARVAKIGYIPYTTTPPGGVFGVVPVGRFAVVSLGARFHGMVPRPSMTRRLLSQPNLDLERQARFDWADTAPSARGATELAYFACAVAVPCQADPSVPAELALAVPNAAVDDWIAWIPLHRLLAMLQMKADASQHGRKSRSTLTIPDKVFPKFRLPKRDDIADNDKGGDA